jgi:hypothetical protein
MRTIHLKEDLVFDCETEISGESEPSTLPDEPVFEATREIASRVQRLHIVWGCANAIVRGMSGKYRRIWNGAIVQLEDSKGTLAVTWRDAESRVMFEGVIAGAWEANAEHMMAHELAHQRLLRIEEQGNLL